MEQRLSREMSFGISDVALECVMAYIDDSRDRDALSQVCQKWYNIDCLTRKHVTISLCYATSPSRLTRRFPRLESLKLKGKPRAAMFNLIPEDWGGYARPWVNEISVAFNCLKSVHFRRMIVRDEDLEVLVQARGHMLLALKLDRSSGFSTDGLLKVAQSCKYLQTLFLEDCSITERDGRWLHELALNNTTLEMLNFCMTELKFINIQDLALIAEHCSSLVSLKVSDSCEILDMVDFFRAASHLEEFCGGSFNGQDVDATRYSNFRFPPKLSRLGLMNFMGKNEMPIIFPCAALLKKLDLQHALLDTGDHCQLIQRCPNLEVLEVSNMIGDIGLEVVAHYCKKLKKLRIESEEDEQEMEDEQGVVVSQRGLSALAQGCRELEYLAVYVSDITNAALESLGTYCKNLCDFRLVLLDKEERITELPLDDGVRSLLLGCGKLRRFALYLRRGGLTDVGLSYIGRYSPNIRYMLLGFVGETDSGLLEFSNGCPRLQKLEMRGCCFSEHALSLAVIRLVSLRYIWVQGENISGNGTELLEMARPYWNIEAIPPKQAVVYDEHGRIIRVGAIEQPAQILAYYSLAGRRTDYPETVIPLYVG